VTGRTYESRISWRAAAFACRAFGDNRIGVRFQYECHDVDGQWYRCYGNELWEFSEDGLMARREASINDLRIDATERRIFGTRPESEYGVEFPLR